MRAVSLDGTDDYLRTPMILDPGNGSFSVFAWIKGGTAGQVILSQEGGANWSMADPTQGSPMTTLTQTSRGADLTTGMVVTDGDWHRVGFVWDGSDRSLYVDEFEVARDAQRNLKSHTGGFFLGAGGNLEPGSHWSGMIDDVQIYSRAVTP